MVTLGIEDDFFRTAVAEVSKRCRQMLVLRTGMAFRWRLLPFSSIFFGV